MACSVKGTRSVVKGIVYLPHKSNITEQGEPAKLVAGQRHLCQTYQVTRIWRVTHAPLLDLHLSSPAYLLKFSSILGLDGMAPPASVVYQLVEAEFSDYPARACAARGKVIEFVCLSVEKILRLCELATSRTSERIRRVENALILLTCTCHWADSLPLSGIFAVFLLSGPLCQPFYLRPPVTPTTYMPHVHLHSCPRPAINFA